MSCNANPERQGGQPLIQFLKSIYDPVPGIEYNFDTELKTSKVQFLLCLQWFQTCFADKVSISRKGLEAFHLILLLSHKQALFLRWCLN